MRPRISMRVCSSVRPSVGWSVRNQLCFFGSLEATFAVCTALFVLVWFVILSVVSDDCLVNVIFIVLLSYCLSFALVCTTVLTTTMLILIVWFWWFDDLMSFQAIVSCHVTCIVRHAIRSMSLIFGRIYICFSLHGISMIGVLGFACLWATACFLLSPRDSWGVCFRPWLRGSSPVVD